MKLKTIFPTSTSLKYGVYNTETRILDLLFQSKIYNKMYRYYDVPLEVIQKLFYWDYSPGKYYSKNIKGKYISAKILIPPGL